MLKIAHFVLQIIYPRFASNTFIVYLVTRYLVEVNFKRKFKEQSINGYKFTVIPDELLKEISEKSLNKSNWDDPYHQIIVPLSLFKKLYSENIFYRDGNSLWISVRIHDFGKLYSKIFKIQTNLKNVPNYLTIDSSRAIVPRNKLSKLPDAKSLKLANIYSERIVQIIPHADSSSDVVSLTETHAFNIRNILGTKYMTEDFQRLKFTSVRSRFMAPAVASRMVVQMVSSSPNITTELLDVMLSNYFNTPKFLHQNDYFGISTTEEYTAHLHMKYFNNLKHISKIYFKCTLLISKFTEHQNEMCPNANVGCFVVKGETELRQEQHINSFIPQRRFLPITRVKKMKTNKKIPINRQFIQSCPFGLTKLFNEMILSIKPFVLDKNVSVLHKELKCVVQPVFLLRADLGAGSEVLTRCLAESLGLNFYTETCRRIVSTTAKQTEAKIDSLFHKAKGISPVLLHLQDFDVLGIDTEKNEDPRIVDSFIKRLKNFFEYFTKFPIVLIASCDTLVELKSNIVRVFLEEFKISVPNKRERLDMLTWLSLTKNAIFCNEDFRPLHQTSNSQIMEPAKDTRSIPSKVPSKKMKGVGKSSKPKELVEVMDNNITQITKFNNTSNKTDDYNCVPGMNREQISKDLNECFIHKKELEILEKISSKTDSFVYGDLDTLTNLSLSNGYLNQKKIYSVSKSLIAEIPKMGYVREKDFEEALESLRLVQSKKLGSLNIPNVQWEDIGALEDLKKEIFRTIELPLKFPHLLANSGLRRSGLLLWGPPGCGKTLVARAISSQLKAAFLSVKGPELLDMYVGQSERNMRDMFAMARASAPCVIFLDEAEAVAGARGASGDSGGAADRLVSQLLAELDGVASRQIDAQTGPVIVIAATNRPDLVEPALLRPGRLDKLLYVGPYQGTSTKLTVLTASCRGMNLSSCVDLEKVSKQLPEKCTGADLASIANKARRFALARVIERVELEKINAATLTEKDVIIMDSDFQKAITNFTPSISPREMDYYESLRSKFLN